MTPLDQTPRILSAGTRFCDFHWKRRRVFECPPQNTVLPSPDFLLASLAPGWGARAAQEARTAGHWTEPPVSSGPGPEGGAAVLSIPLGHWVTGSRPVPCTPTGMTAPTREKGCVYCIRYTWKTRARRMGWAATGCWHGHGHGHPTALAWCSVLTSQGLPTPSARLSGSPYQTRKFSTQRKPCPPPLPHTGTVRFGVTAAFVDSHPATS